MLLRLTSKFPKRYAAFFSTGTTPPSAEEKSEIVPKQKFSLHRMNLLPFASNAIVGSLCLTGAYYNAKSMMFTVGFFHAIGHVPFSVALGITQTGLTILLLYSSKLFFMNTYDICYKAK